MNPARTFGTAVVTSDWSNHWVSFSLRIPFRLGFEERKNENLNGDDCIDFSQVYWAGPILGGVVASLLYTQAFSAPDAEDRAEKYRTDANEKEVRQRTLVL